jgi:hypothetical protein
MKLLFWPKKFLCMPAWQLSQLSQLGLASEAPVAHCGTPEPGSAKAWHNRLQTLANPK